MTGTTILASLTHRHEVLDQLEDAGEAGEVEEAEECRAMVAPEDEVWLREGAHKEEESLVVEEQHQGVVDVDEEEHQLEVEDEVEDSQEEVHSSLITTTKSLAALLNSRVFRHQSLL